MKIGNRTFLCSGASSGLGLETARDLLSAGAYIAILDRAAPPADLDSSKVKYFEIDITDVSQIESAVEGAVEWAKKTGAPLGGVINCAGVGTAAKTIDVFNEPHSLDLWDFTLAVNLTGSFNLTRLALKHLIKVDPEGEDGERGVVIFVSSAAAFEGQPGQVAYAATKGALRSMTLPMARDLARHAVRVVTIAPGAFKSAMTSGMPAKTRRSLENEGVVFPRRMGSPVEDYKTQRWRPFARQVMIVFQYIATPQIHFTIPVREIDVDGGDVWTGSESPCRRLVCADITFASITWIRVSLKLVLAVEMKVANRTFVVSGGSSGLGLATVRGLVDANARVAILDQKTPQETFPPERSLFIQVDITRLEDLQRAVDATVAWTERTGAILGGVIHCAGVGIDEPIIDAKGKAHSVENWERHINVNLTATFNLTRLVLEKLVRVPPENEPGPDGIRSDGERGVVILVSSSAAHEGMPATIAYTATKGAIRALTLPMARDCARFNIRVVTLAPGPFETPLTGRWSERVEKGMSEQSILYPRRYGAPSEFAATVKWVLECSYINGENLRLTGGGRLPARL
uniref:3-hydroxy-acyl-CoA dehydrogenase n=1 Tax=Mycena chlorophos TaxID=658473 RepID=A0ABQ0LZX2_MYCCL|nr:3-hydroxy-acyl-CoA dehydrogenase [Mycena chlorophos]